MVRVLSGDKERCPDTAAVHLIDYMQAVGQGWLVVHGQRRIHQTVTALHVAQTRNAPMNVLQEAGGVHMVVLVAFERLHPRL